MSSAAQSSVSRGRVLGSAAMAGMQELELADKRKMVAGAAASWGKWQLEGLQQERHEKRLVEARTAWLEEVWLEFFKHHRPNSTLAFVCAFPSMAPPTSEQGSLTRSAQRPARPSHDPAGAAALVPGQARARPLTARAAAAAAGHPAGRARDRLARGGRQRAGAHPRLAGRAAHRTRCCYGSGRRRCSHSTPPRHRTTLPSIDGGWSDDS